MPRSRRAGVATLAVWFILLIVLSAVTEASVTSVDPTLAARSCAGGMSLSAQLGAADVAYLGRFVPCAVRQERQQLGLGFSTSRYLSRSVKRLLGRLVRAGYAAHRVQVTALHSAVNSLSAQKCARAKALAGYRFAANFADTEPPPILTPLEVAKGLTVMFSGAAAEAGRAPAATFGVASDRGLFFRHRDLRGADFGVVALRCS